MRLELLLTRGDGQRRDRARRSTTLGAGGTAVSGHRPARRRTPPALATARLLAVLMLGSSAAACTCDWHGANESRRFGPTWTLGPWSVFPQLERRNFGVFDKSGTDRWIVHVALAYDDGGQTQRPTGPPYDGLCGASFSSADMAVDQARREQRALYASDPELEHCDDGQQLAIRCRPDQRFVAASDSWRIFAATEHGIARRESVPASTCQAALQAAATRP